MTTLTEATYRLRGAHAIDAIDAINDFAFAKLDANDIYSCMEAMCEHGEGRVALHLMSRAARSGIQLPLPTRLARILKRSGHESESIDLLRAWAPVDSPNPWNMNVQIKSLWFIGGEQEALAMLAKARSEFPASPQLLDTEIEFMIFQGRVDRAEELMALRRELPSSVPPELVRTLKAISTGQAIAMGFDLYLPPDIVGGRVLKAILDGQYEAAERSALLDDLHSTDRVLELGTGIGLIAMTATRHCPGLPIVTIEANPELAEVVRENFRRNSCTADFVTAAAGLNNGEVKFFLAREFWASAEQPTNDGDRSVFARMIDIRDVMRKFRPTILIIDIEGGEVHLIPNLDLNGLRRIVVEMHPKTTSTEEISGVFRYILDAGFDIALHQGDRDVFCFERPYTYRGDAAGGGSLMGEKGVADERVAVNFHHNGAQRIARTRRFEMLTRFHEEYGHVKGSFNDASAACWSFLMDWQNANGISGNLFEIGVQYGRSAVFSSLYMQEKEIAGFCDLYLRKEAVDLLNTIGAGEKRFLKMSSAQLTPSIQAPEFIANCRWVHIDGSHSGSIFANDLRVANALLGGDGIIVVDDFFSVQYPQITAAVFDFLRSNPWDLRLVLAGYNKGYLCRPLKAQELLHHIKDNFYSGMCDRGQRNIRVFKSTEPGDYNCFGFAPAPEDMSGYHGPDWAPDKITV